ncbi:group I truncated hemoglobin [Aquariibacter albus]|uniref:Group 1 truncated hemoglobin n=1 Tax=Aquariibacter albus TaxID=2759899 RepID=A0A839HLL9_9BURK|nr:group 1 truncated hemoglobin [Aquariibacter albus]MBB1162846.1 group 1 truncated hemoglobin [Aquariibacter albus]
MNRFHRGLALGLFALGAAALLPARAEPAAPAPTLYQQLGGAPAIAKVIDDFVGIVAADSRINFQFAKTDIPRLKQLLREQFGQALGGPERYSGRDMKSSHAGLGITNAQFNALAENLYEALNRNGVPYRVQNVILAKLAPLQPDVVER